MATATSAALAADGTGSNRFSAAPRRGGEIHHDHSSFGLRQTCSKQTNELYALRYRARTRSGIDVRLWRTPKPTCTRTDTNHAIRHSDCNNRATTQDENVASRDLFVLYHSLWWFRLQHNTAVLWWEAKTPSIESYNTNKPTTAWRRRLQLRRLGAGSQQVQCNSPPKR